MSLDDCLPAELRGPATTVTKVAQGLSGAGVYRVDAGGRSYVLKVAGETEMPVLWEHGLQILRLAAGAGLAPRIVHVDEGRRAVVSEFVAGQSFPAFYRTPATHEAALAMLGRTVRRIQDIPVPPNATGKDPLAFLAEIWSGIPADYPVPAFVRDAVARVLAAGPSGGERVLSHNDLNPSNLVYDGERLLLFDWDTAGPNDPYYDLAVLSIFLRMDEGAIRRMLAAYEGGREAAALPDRFVRNRRLASALAGSMFFHLARQLGDPGAAGNETLDTALPLGEFYQRMMAGQLSLATAEGKRAFALAIVKEGLAI